jgi:hypothetical protein
MKPPQIGDQYDSVRAIDSSSRWQVVAIDPVRHTVGIVEIARRIGPPPKTYVEGRRINQPGRFAGWDLEPTEHGEIKVISIETLQRTADYVPAEDAKQTLLF